MNQTQVLMCDHIRSVDCRNNPINKGYVGSCYSKDAKCKQLSFTALVKLLPDGLSRKMLYVKLVLLILVCGSFMGLLHSPSIRHGDDDERGTLYVSKMFHIIMPMHLDVGDQRSVATGKWMHMDSFFSIACQVA